MKIDAQIAKPTHIIEIFLQPGDCYFGESDTRIRTILGSCVAFTMWHPFLRVGGMCHVMLPERAHQASENSTLSLDGRYAEEAVNLMLTNVMQSGRGISDYQIKLFGGSNMFHHAPTKMTNIGDRNIERVRDLIIARGGKIQSSHVGGNVHRYIIFDIWSGHVWMRKPQEIKAENRIAG